MMYDGLVQVDAITAGIDAAAACSSRSGMNPNERSGWRTSASDKVHNNKPGVSLFAWQIDNQK